MKNKMIKPYMGNDCTDGKSYPEKTLDELVNWGTQVHTIRYGQVMLRGWTYDLRPYLKKYLVKSFYDTGIWHETYAMNKAHARMIMGENAKCKVIEIDKD